jgi:hypothetical protein
VSALKVVVDYKPRGLEVMDYSKVVAGGYLWLVAMIPLECASFTLSEIFITNVCGKSERGGQWQSNLSLIFFIFILFIYIIIYLFIFLFVRQRWTNSQKV